MTAKSSRRRILSAAARCAAMLRDAWAIVGIALLLFILLNNAIRRLTPASWVQNKDALRVANDNGSISTEQFDQLASEMLATHDTFDSTAIRWEPLVYWRNKPYNGRFVRVDPEGLRATWTPDTSDSGPTLKVFCFGGSTMWGSGVPDDATIPSELAKLLAASQVRAQVVNYGQLGYNSTQELVALIRECQNGNVPAIAVFYDGINDINAAGMNLRPAVPVRDFMIGSVFDAVQDPTIWQTTTLYVRRCPVARLLAPRWWQASSQRVKQYFKRCPPEQFAADIARTYLTNVSIGTAIARAFRFRCVFFWQPCLFTKRMPSEVERTLLKDDDGQAAFFSMVYDMVRQGRASLPSQGFGESAENLILIDQAFSVPPWDEQTAFFDRWHTTARANHHLARIMFKHIEPAIASAGSSRDAP